MDRLRQDDIERARLDADSAASAWRVGDVNSRDVADVLGSLADVAMEWTEGEPGHYVAEFLPRFLSAAAGALARRAGRIATVEAIAPRAESPQSERTDDDGVAMMVIAPQGTAR